MGKGLHNLARVLEVADELHQKGELSEEVMLKLVDAAETSLDDSERFLRELKQWAADLLQVDDVAKVREVLRSVLIAFLQSRDADDHQLRGDALIVMGQIDKLLIAADNYNQEGLTFKLLRD